MKKRMFECVNGVSNKFWEVWVDDGGLYTRYGKIGTDGQVSCVPYTDDDEANKAAEKIIKSKIKKGYVEV